MTRTVLLVAGLALSLASVPGNAYAQEVGCHDCEEFSPMCLAWGYHYHFQGINWQMSVAVRDYCHQGVSCAWGHAWCDDYASLSEDVDRALEEADIPLLAHLVATNDYVDFPPAETELVVRSQCDRSTWHTVALPADRITALRLELAQRAVPGRPGLQPRG